MSDVVGSGSSLFSKETFDKMIADIDADGDGNVTKAEYKVAYMKAFPNTSDKEFDKVWGKIDADGDGDLTVAELAKFYGFNIEKDDAEEMTDEDILKMLQLQAAAEEVARKEEKKDEPPKKAITKERDPTVASIQIDKKYPEGSTEVELAEFLRQAKECAVFPGSLREILQTLSPSSSDGDATGKLCKLNLRIEDADKKTPLNMLASVKYEELKKEIKPIYEAVIKTLLACMRVQAEAAGKAVKDDVNIQDKYGKTAFFAAAEAGNTFLIKQLYAAAPEGMAAFGPDPMMSAANGWNILHAAIQSNKMKAMELVVDMIGKGRTAALLKAKDKMGRAPLHLAAYAGSEDLVKFTTNKCKELSIDLTQKDTAGNSAATLASKGNRRRSREIIDDATK